jgi:hypothetical protein
MNTAGDDGAGVSRGRGVARMNTAGDDAERLRAMRTKREWRQ